MAKKASNKPAARKTAASAEIHDIPSAVKGAEPHENVRERGTPLRLAPDDFEIYDTQHATTSSTVLLLDMSWSMSWEGRFVAAKKVAMAM